MAEGQPGAGPRRFPLPMGRSGTITVVFTDIVGSTALLARLGEQAWDEVRRRHFTALRTALADHDGTEVKNTGDGIMAVFASVVDAVACALDMVRRAGQVDAAGGQVGIRIGVSAGEAQHEGGDWFGTPVVEAARLCALAGEDQAWATSTVRLLAGSATQARFAAVGPQTLKGFEEPVEAFAIEPGEDPLASAFARVDLHDEHGDRMVASLDFWESVPAIQRVRAAGMAALAPLPGDVVCDIGCGAGAELVHLARIVGPDGAAIGVDPSAPILEECRRRADAGGVRVDLLVRDGRETGLPDDHCDGVRMERVVQHVGDVDAFFAEAVRITRPGGRIVAIETDWGSWMIHPGDREFLRRAQRATEDHLLGEAWAGRQLAAALSRAGCTDVRAEVVAVEPGEGLLVPIRPVYERLVDAGVVTRDEVDEHFELWRDAFARGTATAAFCMFVASGRVPEDGRQAPSSSPRSSSATSR